MFYARANVDGVRTFLHNVILGTQAGERPDHINRNRLDNRRENLRPATHSLNMVNRATRNKTGFRGVRKQNCGGYQAILKKKALGTFPTAEEAAEAFDVAAQQAYGEFAVLNFPIQFGNTAAKGATLRLAAS